MLCNYCNGLMMAVDRGATPAPTHLRAELSAYIEHWNKCPVCRVSGWAETATCVRCWRRTSAIASPRQGDCYVKALNVAPEVAALVNQEDRAILTREAATAYECVTSGESSVWWREGDRAAASCGAAAHGGPASCGQMRAFWPRRTWG